jgi:hypothetical protein
MQSNSLRLVADLKRSKHPTSTEELVIDAGVFGAVAEVIVGDALPFAVGVAFLAGVAEFDFGVGIDGKMESAVDAFHYAVSVKHVFHFAVVKDEQ